MRPFGVLFEEYRYPESSTTCSTDFFSSIKEVVQCLIIFAFNYQPTAQVLMVMLAEIFYFGHTLVCNIKVSLSLRIVDMLTELLLIVYLFLKMITTLTSVSEDTRQKQLGTAMVVCVYGIIVVSICFALFSLMLILFQLSKQLIKKCIRQETTSQSSPCLLRMTLSSDPF